MSYKSILLVTICVSTLATASTSSENSSINDKADDILWRTKRNIYLDEYEDESPSDKVIRRKPSSDDIKDEYSQDTKFGNPPPSKTNSSPTIKFDSLKSLYKYSQGKLSRRSNVNVNPNVINITTLGNSSQNSSEPANNNVTTLGTELTGEVWGLVYPSYKTKENQIPKDVIITFLISHQFRENLLYFFGCLLQRPVEFLTEPQYTALYNLHIELRNRPSRINSVLPDLKNVSSSNLNDQMKTIMEIFGRVLPPYVACAANFWVREIEENRINFGNLPSNSCPSNFNILQDVNADGITMPSIMTPIDAPTRMTEYALGQIFVKIIHDVQNFKVVLSQAMFGIILYNFPLIPYDPILEEYIRYIFDIAIKAKIPSWQDIEMQQLAGDPYRFIKNIIGSILVVSNVPQSIKEALVYIRLHLKPVPNSHINPDFQIMHKINIDKFDIRSLFSFIVPEIYSKETICLKNRFLKYVQKHRLPHSWQLSEVDRLRYINPQDLLFAYLTKLQKHIPDENSELANTVTALLSVLVIDKQNKQFSPMTRNFEVLSLFGYLASPDFGPQVNSIYHKFMNIMLSNPDLQFAITKIISGKNGKCTVIDDCLKEIIHNLEQLNLDIPRRMEKIIGELNKIIPVQAIDPKCKGFCYNDSVTNIVTEPPNIQDLYNVNKINHITGSVKEFGNGPGPNSGLDFSSGYKHKTGYNFGSNSNSNFGSNFGSNSDFGFGSNDHFGFDYNPRSNSDFDYNSAYNYNDKLGFNSNSEFGLVPGNNQVNIKKTVVENVLMLPPMMQATRQLTIYVNRNGVPIVDNSNIPSYPGNAKVTLPSVILVLNVPEISDPFGSMDQDFKQHILEPLIEISGSKDLSSILKTSVTNVISNGECPTLAALLVLLLEQAKTNPIVQRHQHLLAYIKTYIAGLDLLAVIVFPIVLKVANIYPQNGVLYSMISVSKPYKSSVYIYPPSNVPQGMLVFAVVDPNILREPVNPQNPFDDLLPKVDPNTPGGKYVEELRVFFTQDKISRLFPNFKPEEYTSKGFLLMVILQKLPKIPEIAKDPRLKKIVIGYIWAFQIPAFFMKVSYPDVLVALGNQPRIKPDTTVLTKLLPQPHSQRETIFFTKMHSLLERDDLFDILLIPKPTPNTNQKELLKMIIPGVISSAEKFDSLTVSACKFYKKKISGVMKGSLPLTWEMENHEVTRFKVQLGDLIENVIDYDDLSNEDKNAYNNLLEYFRENSKIFSLMQEFNFKQFKTEGTFIKGLLMFLLKNQIITQSAKSSVKALLPHVKLNGPGARKLKMTRSGKPSSGRRSTKSKLEIEI